MASDDVRDDRRYTKEHEWAKQEGDEIRIGITAYAVDQLGDITLVNLDVKVDDNIDSEAAFGTIESVKTLSDLFAPMAGTITGINEQLNDNPEAVNDDCYEAWMISMKPSTPDTLEQLMDAAAYRALLKSLD